MKYLISNQTKDEETFHTFNSLKSAFDWLVSGILSEVLHRTFYS